MIKNNNNSFSSVYDETTVIEKIYKGTLKVYEGWRNLIASGVPPLTLLNCKGVDLVDYKLYGNSVQAILPSEYQQVEYIESTGTQFFDTGFKANENTRMVVDFKNKTTSTSGLAMFFGARNYYNNSGFGVAISPGGGYIYWGNYNYADYEFRLNTKIRTKYDISKNGAIIGDIFLELPDTTFTGWYPITLLTLNSNSGYDTRYAVGELYSCKIYDNDVLVRDFIPCYRKSDNVIGLYDVVNDVFYENIGTGEFLKGNDTNGTPTPETPIEVESVGEYDETIGKYKIPVKVSNGTEEIITNIYLNEPLRKIGDYGDYIDFENKKVVRKIKETIFNGTENWKKNPYGTNAYYLVDNTLLISTNKKLVVSTHFKGVLYDDRTIAENNIVFIDYGNVAINVRNTDHNEVDSFKDFLKNNEVKVNCVLATPTEETIELPNIPTLKGTTILSVDTTIQPSNLEVVYKQGNSTTPTINNIEKLEKTDISIIEEKTVKEVEG